jgi:hypothetical protein
MHSEAAANAASRDAFDALHLQDRGVQERLWDVLNSLPQANRDALE